MRGVRGIISLLCISGLSACGGGGGGSASLAPTPPASSSPTPSKVTISGKLTYDRIVHDGLTHGLNYETPKSLPIRGVTVEALNNQGTIIATTKANDEGEYALRVTGSQTVKIRAKADITQPNWAVKITNNVEDNALFSLSGAALDAGTKDSTRNLHAASGWDGETYSEVRAAAPFAILDTVYAVSKSVTDAHENLVLPPLEIRWSDKNRAALGNESQGFIGTSSYKTEGDRGYIYILGDANMDTDEYDQHVIVHEWAHYFEHQVSRGDSIGGRHGIRDKLDPRVAFSEGWGNALSAIMLDDPIYRDSSGPRQSGGFSINVDSNFTKDPGWFSEASVQSVLYDLHDHHADHRDNLSLPLKTLFEAQMHAHHKETDSFTTIYSYIDALKTLTPDNAGLIDDLVQAQSISGIGAIGEGEQNDGDIASALPVYKPLHVGVTNEVCSVNDAGRFNKLGNRAFLTFTVAEAGAYNIQMSGTGNTNPDFRVLSKGKIMGLFDAETSDKETGTISLETGTYIIETYAAENLSDLVSKSANSCFNIQATRI